MAIYKSTNPYLNGEMKPETPDLVMYAKGININSVTPISEDIDDRYNYAVSFEFLVFYGDGSSRWVKDVVLLSRDPNSPQFRLALINYADKVREAMLEETFKLNKRG